MPRVKYTSEGGHFRVAGYGFDPGDTQDVNDDLAEYLDERNDFEIVSETDETDGDADIDEEEAPSGTLPFNPEEHTNAEIEERVQDIDDAETLVALRNLEAEQKDRDGATGAINDRLDELEG